MKFHVPLIQQFPLETLIVESANPQNAGVIYQHALFFGFSISDRPFILCSILHKIMLPCQMSVHPEFHR